MQVEFCFLTDDAVDRRAQLLFDAHEMFRSSADDNRLLGITLHINRHNDVGFAIVSRSAIVVFRIFNGIHDHGQRVRQLVIQFFQECATNQFRNGFFRTFFGNLFSRIHLRTFRHVFDKHVLDFGKIVMLECADRHDISEISELVDFDKFVDQSFAA